jgi:hypothetical protein
MYDQIDAVNNVNQIYNSNTQFSVLKDFERVLDELDIYVYDNWEDGELVAGPEIERHWVTCSFMWDYKSMPDPDGGKRLTDYDCKVSFEKTHFISPRKIKTPDDLRPMSKKGKLDRHPVWVVTIKMPKTLIADIYTGYNDAIESMKEPTTQVQQPVDVNQEQELDTDLDTI